jgi:hypothetical protein
MAPLETAMHDMNDAMMKENKGNNCKRGMGFLSLVTR